MGLGDALAAVLKLKGDSAGALAAIRKVRQELSLVKMAAAEVSKVGKTLTTTVTLPLVAMGVAAGKVGSDFEAGFAGVEKTVDDLRDSTGELTALGQQLRADLRGIATDIPIAVGAVNEIAEAAGQLGIQTPNITGFTRVMGMLAETTNLGAQDGATSLARLANITGMSQDKFSNLGSTVVELGNNLATTEGEIVDMSQRLAAAATGAGFVESDILALAGALSSVGMQAEAGGTALSTVIATMQQAVMAGGDDLERFASVAGMSGSAFSQAFEDDAAGALTTFVEGLGQVQAAGGDVYAILDNLELGGIRVTRSLLSLASAGNLTRDALEMASEAWEENIALTEEAEKRFRTLPAQVQLAKNKLIDIGISLYDTVRPALVEIVAGFNSLLDILSRVPQPVLVVMVAVAGLVAAIGPLLLAIGGLASFVVSATTAITTIGGALATFSGIIPAVLVIVGALGAAIGALTAVIVVLRKAWEEDWGGIRTAVTGAWQEIKPKLDALMGLLGGWGKQILGDLMALGKTLWTFVQSWLAPSLERIAQIIQAINWDQVFGTISDAANVFFKNLSAIIWAINHLLRGEPKQALAVMKDAFVNTLTLIALLFDRYGKAALNWGANLIIQLANGMLAAAKGILSSALGAIGGLIGLFFAPGSPPKKGPLSNIVKWAQGVMNVYLRSFKTADYGLLRDSVAPIKQALESALQAGDIDEKQFAGALKQARTEVAGLIAAYRETGQVSEEHLGRIAEVLGEGSEEYVELLRRQMQFQKAQDKLASIEEEVANARAKGFVPKALRDRLAAAKQEADSAKDAMDWQKEYLAAQQESVGLQLRLVEALDELGGSLGKIGEGMAEVAGALKDGLGGGGPGGRGNLGKDGLLGGLLPEDIGQMSDEFNEMKRKVEAFLALPLDGKLMAVAQYLEEATGIDFTGFLQGIFDVADQIEKEGLLSVVEEWIGKGLDYIEENWETWASDIFGWLLEMFLQAIGLTEEESDDMAERLRGILTVTLEHLKPKLSADTPTWSTALKTWFLSVVVRWILSMYANLEALSNDLKNWLRALLVMFVDKAIEKGGEWLSGLAAIGGVIVGKIREGVSGAWDMVGFIGGKLAEIAGSVMSGEWLNNLLDVGSAIVENIKQGIRNSWASFLQWIRDRLAEIGWDLPGSEPRNRASPLYGLSKRGAAIAENLAAGIDFAPVRQAIQRELAITGRLLQGTNIGSQSIQFGDLLFPNVRDGRDAGSIRRQLSHRALEGSMANVNSW